MFRAPEEVGDRRADHTDPADVRASQERQFERLEAGRAVLVRKAIGAGAESEISQSCRRPAGMRVAFGGAGRHVGANDRRPRPIR